jgi:hypothetical protein
VTELFHITERAAWLDAVQAGEYRMSTRGKSAGMRRAGLSCPGCPDYGTR